jgi:hypothetical protein
VRTEKPKRRHKEGLAHDEIRLGDRADPLPYCRCRDASMSHIVAFATDLPDGQITF